MDLRGLRYGDVVSINWKGNSLLTASGHIDESLRCQFIDEGARIPPNVDECLFEVRIKYRYTVVRQRDVEEDRQERIFGAGTPRKEGSPQEIEEAFNNAEFLRSVGTHVLYGHIVQLLHVASQKFVTVRRTQAELQKSCLKVILLNKGDVGSWLTVSPAYPVKEEGEKVVFGDALAFKSVRFTGAGLHVSEMSFTRQLCDSHPYISDIREVNAGADVATLQLVPFTLHAALLPNPHQVFKGGDVVVLIHRASEMVLSAVDGRVRFERSGEEGSVSSNALWRLEKPSMEWGGERATHTKGYYLKHLASGCFLDSKKTSEGTNSTHFGAELGLTDSYKQRDAVWKIAQVGGLLAENEDGIAYRLLVSVKGFRGYVSRGDILSTEDNIAPDLLIGTSNIMPTGLTASWEQKDALVFEPAPLSLVNVVVAERELVSHLKGFIRALERVKFVGEPLPHEDLRSRDVESTCCGWTRAGRDEEGEGAALVESRRAALLRFSIVMGPDCNPGVFVYRGSITDILLRQCISLERDRTGSRSTQSLSVRTLQFVHWEQKVPMLVATMLKQLVEDIKLPWTSLQNQDLFEGFPILHLCRLMNRFLQATCRCFPPAQQQIAVFAPLLMGLVASETDSAATLMAVFMNNPALISQVSEDKIRFMFGTFRNIQLPVFVQFLRVLCSCEGAPFRENQNLVVGLLKMHPEVLIDVQIKSSAEPQSLEKTKITLQNIRGLKVDCCTFSGRDDLNGQCSTTGWIAEDLLFINYLAMLELFCSLCMQRNHKAISWLLSDSVRFGLDYDTILSIVFNNELPFNVRTLYCQLLVLLYIDREPHVTMQQRRFTLTWTAIVDPRDDSDMEFSPSYTAFADPSHNYPTNALEVDFVRLKKLTFSFFHSTDLRFNSSKPGQSSLILELLRMCNKMLQFGLFGTFSRDWDGSIALLVDAIIPLLDGRHDTGSDRLRHGRHARFEEHPGSRIIMEAKTTICDMLMYLFDMRINWCISLAFGRFSNLGKRTTSSVWDITEHLAAAEVRQTGDISELSGTLSSYAQHYGIRNSFQHLFPKWQGSGIDSPHRASDAKDRKRGMGKGKLGVWTISKLTAWRKRSTTSPRSTPVLTIANDGPPDLRVFERLYGELFSMPALSPSAHEGTAKGIPYMMEALLDLTRYKFAPLKALAFSLIDRYMTEKSSILQGMLKAQLIVEDDVLKLHKEVAQDVHAVRSFRSWLVSDNEAIHGDFMKRCIGTVRKFRNLCDPAVQPKDSKILKHQLVLRSLGAHEAIVELLQTPFKRKPSRQATDLCRMEDKGLETLFTAAYSFLEMFCSGVTNEENQRALVKHLDLFLAHRDLENVNATGCISAVVKDNYEFCSEMEEDLIRSYFRLILRYGKRANWLQFLKVTMVAHEKIIKSNQMLVTNLLLQHFDRVASLPKTPEDWRTRRQWMVEKEHIEAGLGSKLMYHISFVSLLAACCSEKQAANAVKIGSLVSLTDVMETLLWLSKESTFAVSANSVAQNASQADRRGNDSAIGNRGGFGTTKGSLRRQQGLDLGSIFDSPYIAGKVSGSGIKSDGKDVHPPEENGIGIDCREKNAVEASQTPGTNRMSLLQRRGTSPLLNVESVMMNDVSRSLPKFSSDTFLTGEQNGVEKAEDSRALVCPGFSPVSHDQFPGFAVVDSCVTEKLPLDTSIIRLVKCAYLTLLHHGFVSGQSEKAMTELRGHRSGMWPAQGHQELEEAVLGLVSNQREGSSCLMQDLTAELNCALAEPDVPRPVEGSARHLVLVAILPMLTAYFKRHFIGRSQLPFSHKVMLDGLIGAVKRLAEALPLGEKEVAARCLEEMRVAGALVGGYSKNVFALPSPVVKMEREDADASEEGKRLRANWISFCKLFGKKLQINDLHPADNSGARSLALLLSQHKVVPNSSPPFSYSHVVVELTSLLSGQTIPHEMSPEIMVQLLRVARALVYLSDGVDAFANASGDSEEVRVLREKEEKERKMLRWEMFEKGVPVRNSKESLQALERAQNKYADLGLASCAIHLVSHPSQTVRAEAVKLAITLTDEGNAHVQGIMYHSIVQNQDFFYSIKRELAAASASVKYVRKSMEKAEKQGRGKSVYVAGLRMGTGNRRQGSMRKPSQSRTSLERGWTSSLARDLAEAEMPLLDSEDSKSESRTPSLQASQEPSTETIREEEEEEEEEDDDEEDKDKRNNGDLKESGGIPKWGSKDSILQRKAWGILSGHVYDLLRMLQLLCEGHNGQMQRLLRVQDDLQEGIGHGIAGLEGASGGKRVNLLHEVIVFLEHLQPALDKNLETRKPVLVGIALQALNTVVEAIQGPCLENQLVVVRSSFLTIAEHMMHSLAYREEVLGENILRFPREVLGDVLHYTSLGSHWTEDDIDKSSPKLGPNDLRCWLRNGVLTLYLSLLEEIGTNVEIPGKMAAIIRFPVLIQRCKQMQSILLDDRIAESKETGGDSSSGDGLKEAQHALSGNHNKEGTHSLPKTLAAGIGAGSLKFVGKIANPYMPMKNAGRVPSTGKPNPVGGRRSQLFKSPIWASFTADTRRFLLRSEVLNSLILLVKLDNFDALMVTLGRSLSLKPEPQIAVSHSEFLVHPVRLPGSQSTKHCTFSYSKCEKPQRCGNFCFEHTLSTDKALQYFFDKCTCAIEVVREGQLEKVYFPLTAECRRVSQDSKWTQRTLEELYEVPRENPVQKVQQFMAVAHHLMLKLQHNERMRRRRPWSSLMQRRSAEIKRGPFYLSVVIVTILVLSYGQTRSSWDRHITAWVLIKVLGVIQALVAVLALMTVVLVESPFLILKAAQREHEKDVHDAIANQAEDNEEDETERDREEVEHLGNHLQQLQDLEHMPWRHILKCADFWYFVSLVLASIAGIFLSPFFFVFHLLDFLVYHPSGALVLQSAYVGGPLLLRTGLVGVLVIFMYSVVSFLAYGGPRPDSICTTLYECIGLHMVNAVSTSTIGGLWETWEEVPESVLDNPVKQLRTIFILSFLVIWVFLLQNIFTGQIVDAFTSIRDERAAKEKDVDDKCFVCSIGRFSFERRLGGFLNHVKREHNPLHYLFYLDYLFKRNPTEYTGLESYVRQHLDASKYDWIPIGRAMQTDREMPLGMEQNDKKVEEDPDALKRIESLLVSIKSSLDPSQSKPLKKLGKVKIEPKRSGSSKRLVVEGPLRRSQTTPAVLQRNLNTARNLGTLTSFLENLGGLD